MLYMFGRSIKSVIVTTPAERADRPREAPEPTRSAGLLASPLVQHSAAFAGGTIVAWQARQTESITQTAVLKQVRCEYTSQPRISARLGRFATAEAWHFSEVHAVSLVYFGDANSTGWLASHRDST